MKLCRPISMFVLCVIITWSVGARGDDKKHPLDKAREDYTSAIKAAEIKLSKSIDKTSEKVASRKLPTEQKLALLDAVREETKRFNEKGLIPWSEPNWLYVQAYMTSLHAAEAQLRKTFNLEIDKALKAKDDEKVRDLRTELKSVVEAKVIAAWQYETGMKEVCQLYSNGKVNEVDSPITWLLDNKNTLIIKRPNAQAPGGMAIDTCTVSVDGKTFTGTTNRGGKVGGHYIDP